MKTLLAAKGIETVAYIDEDNISHLFAYTKEMLAKWIFVELFEEENTEDAGNGEGSKTGINVFMTQNNKCYEFYMLLDTRPRVPRIDLYRSILDTITVIETSDAFSLTGNLEQAASASVSTDVYLAKHWQDDFNNKVKGKIQQVLALIAAAEKALI